MRTALDTAENAGEKGKPRNNRKYTEKYGKTKRKEKIEKKEEFFFK